jgi:hypothetical protein
LDKNAQVFRKKTDIVNKGDSVSKSFVLEALKIFSLEEILRLSQAFKVKSSLMKKAAGQELVFWGDAKEDQDTTEKNSEQQEAKILPFKNTTDSQLPEAQLTSVESANPTPSSDPPILGLVSNELLFLKEITKNPDNPMLKKEAIEGYLKATDIYIVKNSRIEGKEKIRFASTQGVLINKKQA